MDVAVIHHKHKQPPGCNWAVCEREKELPAKLLNYTVEVLDYLYRVMWVTPRLLLVD